MKYQDFRTSHFYLAAFLCARGMELTGIDRTDPRRCQFIFKDTPQREKLVEAFHFAPKNSEPALVDARSLITAIKQLKDRLYHD